MLVDVSTSCSWVNMSAHEERACKIDAISNVKNAEHAAFGVAIITHTRGIQLNALIHVLTDSLEVVR